MSTLNAEVREDCARYRHERGEPDHCWLPICAYEGRHRA